MTNERTLAIIDNDIGHHYDSGEGKEHGDLFSINGYEATSIWQLADAVGIRKKSCEVRTLAEYQKGDL